MPMDSEKTLYHAMSLRGALRRSLSRVCRGTQDLQLRVEAISKPQQGDYFAFGLRSMLQALLALLGYRL
ncbi:MAG: hypothetical protein AMJ88_15095 [Anaerolineae bacterium SM23_ 63]|nr:MAG: hypothetical protein AMJ88_15095 [Anaerolineae bacterium SM23_ 63]